MEMQKGVWGRFLLEMGREMGEDGGKRKDSAMELTPQETWRQRVKAMKGERPSDAGPGPYRIIYHISGHGLGHAVRSCRIIERFAKNPEVRFIEVGTGTTRKFVRERLQPRLTEEQWKKIHLFEAHYDPGMVQADSVRADAEATEKECKWYVENWMDLVKEEASWIRWWNPHLVLSDVGAVPLAAAGSLGYPGFAIGNFTWDWIYEPLVTAEGDLTFFKLRELYRLGYAEALAWFQLPFGPRVKRGPCRMTFPVRMVAGRGVERRFEIARATGADPRKPWVLLSFAKVAWDKAARNEVSGGLDAEYIVMDPLSWGARMPKNFRRVSPKEFAFTDVVASCDAVLSKPGYGIVTDCIVNHKPLVYAERPDFREYAWLKEGIEDYGVGECITQATLYSGKVGAALERALSKPWRPRKTMWHDGAAQITNLLWAFLKMPKDLKEGEDWTMPKADWGDSDESDDGGDV